MALQVLKITDPGAIEKLTTPAKAADLTALEDIIKIGITLKNSLSTHPSFNKPNSVRMRAACLCAPQIGEDANMFVMYYVPEGNSDPVWRVFVNPVITPTADAQLLEDENYSLSTPFIRTKIKRPDKVKLTADLAFDIPPDASPEDIDNYCHQTTQRDYKEILQERPLTQEELDREGLRKPNLNGNGFIAQFAVDLLNGISPIHHVPEAQVEAFIENNHSGPNLITAAEYYQARGAEDPNAGKPPSPEQLKALAEFYDRGRSKLALAATTRNEVNPPALVL